MEKNNNGTTQININWLSCIYDDHLNPYKMVVCEN